MEVKDIVKSYLIANGFDGLCNIDCGCEISDVFPCGQSFEYCEPGYKKIINESGDWGIIPISTDETSKQDKYMNTVTAQQLNELSKEIHALAVEKGWWDTERSRGEVYALIHSEISEAVEEARKDRPQIYSVAKDRLTGIGAINRWSGDEPNNRKPEGELIELADVVIRCLDWMGKIGMEATEKGMHPSFFIGMNPLEAYEFLHETLVLSGVDSFPSHCVSYAEHRGWDLLGAIRIKHEYNKTRPHRHGGKKY